MTNRVNYEDLKKHVVSADLAEQLEKAGFPQNTFFSWFITTDVDDTPRLNRTDENCPTCSLPQQAFEKKVAAPLASEIGEQLQSYTVSNAGEINLDELVIEKRALYWAVSYGSGLDHEEYDDSMTNALAKFWLYLKTHHLLEEGRTT